MALPLQQDVQPPVAEAPALARQLLQPRSQQPILRTRPLTISKLPLARDVEEFVFEGTPINEMLVRDLPPR